MSQTGILLAMRGTAEETLLRQLHAHPHLSVVRRCADAAEVLAAAVAGVGDLAVIDSSLGVDRSFILHLRNAGVRPFVLAPPADHEDIRGIGAHPLDLSETDLLSAIQRALADEAEVAPADPVDETGPLRTPKVIAVASPWGSPGRTTVAVNLAAELALRGGTPLLVDADLWGASVKQNLGLDPDGAGLAAALRAVERGTLDVEGLVRVTEERFGIRILGGLNRSDRWREAAGPTLESFWDVVRTWPGYVVIDSPVRLPATDGAAGGFGPAPNDMWDSVWATATHRCLVGGADTVGVHRFVNFYLDLQTDSPHVVINRVRSSAAGPRANESVRELLARFAGVSDPILIPDDPQVDRSVLEVATLARVSPRGPARLAIEELSLRFLPARERGTKRRTRPRRQRNGAH